jgi:hypothetical protein
LVAGVDENVGGVRLQRSRFLEQIMAVTRRQLSEEEERGCGEQGDEVIWLLYGETSLNGYEHRTCEWTCCFAKKISIESLRKRGILFNGPMIMFLGGFAIT